MPSAALRIQLIFSMRQSLFRDFVTKAIHTDQDARNLLALPLRQQFSAVDDESSSTDHDERRTAGLLDDGSTGDLHVKTRSRSLYRKRVAGNDAVARTKGLSTKRRRLPLDADPDPPSLLALLADNEDTLLESAIIEGARCIRMTRLYR